MTPEWQALMGWFRITNRRLKHQEFHKGHSTRCRETCQLGEEESVNLMKGKDEQELLLLYLELGAECEYSKLLYYVRDRWDII